MKIGNKSNSELAPARRASFMALLLAALIAPTAHAQVVPAGDQGGVIISAGAMGSGAMLQYGDRKMLGITGFVVVDTRRRLGLEAEGRWLEFNQTENVHAETFSAGARYHYDVNNFQPYAKGLIGFANFNFPYNLATGKYLAITAGGGVEYKLSEKLHIRIADFEYQTWPQFTYGNFNTISVSTGIRVRIR
jgi:opacity protein-like surface antigen